MVKRCNIWHSENNKKTGGEFSDKVITYACTRQGDLLNPLDFITVMDKIINSGKQVKVCKLQDHLNLHDMQVIEAKKYNVEIYIK